METRQQANPQRVIGIPHVLRSTYQVVTESEPPEHIQTPSNPNERREERLARNQERLPQPEPQASNDHADVAEVQHILPAPVPGIEREPCEQPKECGPARNRKSFCFCQHGLSFECQVRKAYHKAQVQNGAWTVLTDA